MCGFAGRIYLRPRRVEHLASIGARMNRCVGHRGPDGSGIWTESFGHAVLAFSRLAIQDLSTAADQPMHSESGRYVIVYNGEIYNCDELLRLAGRDSTSLRTHSDTEVLLDCIEKYGLDQTLRASNGMFALALWDNKHRALSFARDRFGEKPLHFALTKDHLTFASEIKSILAVDEQPRLLSPEAVNAYFALTYIPGSLCMFKGIQKVKAGHIVEINANLACNERSFWNLEEVIGKQIEGKPCSLEEATEETETLLRDSVRRRLISDVPVGVLLSGGIDSSLVAFTVAKTLGLSIKTFTIGLEDSHLDESIQASSVADMLGVENECLILTNQEALSTLESLVEILDEPFGDGSAASTFAACRLARGKATVLLGGDGGDEIFGGYTRYQYAAGWRLFASTLYSHMRCKNAWLSKHEVAVEIYRRLMTTGSDGGSATAAFVDSFVAASELLPGLTVLQYMRYIDIKSYLPDDILVKTDRMSMANSVELRSPFLDHRIVEKSWGWGDHFFVRGSLRKLILRNLFVASLGPQMLQRKKYGFHSPISAWLRGPLRQGMEDAIEQIKRSDEIPLSEKAVRESWSALLGGDDRPEQRLWNLYMFWRWSVRWRSRPEPQCIARQD